MSNISAPARQSLSEYMEQLRKCENISDYVIESDGNGNVNVRFIPMPAIKKITIGKVEQ